MTEKNAMSDAGKNHNKFTLFFRQISKAEYQNKIWKDKPENKPLPFVSLDINAKTLPDAVRTAWKQLAGQDISNIAEIHFQGLMLKTDYGVPKRDLTNMYYNACMGILPSKAELRLLNIAYRQYLMPPKEEGSQQWFIANYGHDLVRRLNTGESEAFDEVYGSDFTLKMMEKGGVSRYHIPNYVSALKDIRREMSGFEGQMEMARNIHKTIFRTDMPNPSDIFLREYFYGVAAETADPTITETLKILLKDDCLDELRKEIDSGYLPGGIDVNEYIPIISWDINERYYLTDFSGHCFLEEFPSVVKHCVNKAVEENASGLTELLGKHKNDLRPFADYLGTMISSGLFKEADMIASDLSCRGIRIKHIISDTEFDNLNNWRLAQKSQENPKTQETGKKSLHDALNRGKEKAAQADAVRTEQEDKPLYRKRGVQNHGD